MTTEQRPYLKPIPSASYDTKPFWDAMHEHKLMLPKCNNCGKISFPPRAFCPDCLDFNVQWTELSGRGTVHTFTVVYQNRSPGFADEVPYVAGYITLDEGPQMMSNVIGIPPEDVRVDMKVEIVYDDVTPEVTLPRFKPV